MIGIQLEGDTEFLETLPETSISLKLENPIFGTPDKISPGSYSYSFDLPGGDRSEINSRKLKNPDVVENNENYVSQRAKLFFNGEPFKDGKLTTEKSTKDSFSTFLTFGLNSINPYFKTARLRNVCYDSFSIPATLQKKLYLKQTVSGDLNIIFNDKEYTEPDSGSKWVNLAIQLGIDGFNETLDKPDKWWPKISAISASGSTPSGLITGGFVTIILSQFYTISPGVYGENEMCVDLTKELSVKIAPEFVADYTIEADMGSYYTPFATFLNPYATTSPTTEAIRFPLAFNANMHNELTRDELVNGYNTGGIILNNPNWGLQNSQPWVVKNFNSIQPYARLKYVLDRIRLALGVSFDGDWYEDPDTQDMLIDNSFALDLPQNFIGDNKFVFWKTTFTLADLVPDVTVIDFLKALQSRYNFAIYVNENTGKVSLKKREPIATSIQYEDITGWASPIQEQQPERYSGYTFRLEKEETDAFSAGESFIYGTPETEYTVNCGRLSVEKSIYIDGGLVQGPYKSQLASSKFNLRIFHYEGIVNNGSFDYPKAKLQATAYNEDLETIHNTFWLYWLFFDINRVIVKTVINFHTRQLKYFDWTLKRRFDRTNYLIKSIDARISNTGFKVTAVELYTMK